MERIRISSLLRISLLISALISSCQTDCGDDELDKEYIMVFMDTNIPDSEATVMYSSPESATISINTPSLPSGDAAHVTFTESVSPNGFGSKNLGASIKITQPTITPKVVRITGDKGFAAFGMNDIKSGCDGYFAIPTERLGREYYTMNHSPPQAWMVAAVAAGSAGARVAIYPLDARLGPLSVNGQQVQRGASIILDLGAYQAIQIKSDDSFSGTKILADKPVAVFSGNVKENVNNFESEENFAHFTEQLLPYSQWGQKHFVMAFPDQDYTYLRFVSPDNAEVKVYYSTFGYTTVSPEQPIYTKESAYRMLTISSDKPVQVAQYAESFETQNAKFSSRPTMTIIPPQNRWKKRYVFVIPNETPMTHRIIITIAKGKESGLMLDNVQVGTTGWTEFPASGTPAMMGRIYDPSVGGAHTLSHPDTEFGAVLYGSNPGKCNYAWPAGYCIPKNPDASLSTDFPTAAPAPPPDLTPAPSTPSPSPNTPDPNPNNPTTTTAKKPAASAAVALNISTFLCLFTAICLVVTV